MSAVTHLAPTERPAIYQPPHSTEIEQALLGTLLRSNGTMERIEFLEDRHFFEPVHQRIFKSIRAHTEAGAVASPVSLAPQFAQDPTLADTGATAYLMSLYRASMLPMNVEQYGRQVIDLWQRREAIAIAQQIMADAVEVRPDMPVSDILSSAQRDLDGLEQGSAAGTGMRRIGDFIGRSLESAQEALNNPGQLRGLSTGIQTLDKRTGGMKPKDLIILAGRTSMGKSALAMNIAMNVAQAGHPVGFFTLEMSADDLTNRALSTEGGIDSMAVQNATINREQFDRFYDAAMRSRDLPLFLNEEGTMSMADIRREARALKRSQGLSLLVVDYLQLVHTPGAKYGDRVQAVSEVTRLLKALAKELGVPVIALAQLSRALEARDDKRPQLADLRESGSIEQDADAVWFVYREEYYLSRAEPSQKSGESSDKFQTRSNEWREQMFKVRNLAEVIVGKQRKGPTGKCILRFEPTITKFSDLHAGAAGAEGYEE